LPATAGDHLVDPGGGQRLPVACSEPQLVPPGLGVAGAGAQVPVQAAGGLVADLDDPVLAALAADGDLPLPQAMSLRRGSPGPYRRPASSDSRMPVAVNTAMIAVSRRWAKLRPAHTCSSLDSSPG
jgi:hypothetical protein